MSAPRRTSTTIRAALAAATLLMTACSSAAPSAGSPAAVTASIADPVVTTDPAIETSVAVSDLNPVPSTSAEPTTGGPTTSGPATDSTTPEGPTSVESTPGDTESSGAPSTTPDPRPADSAALVITAADRTTAAAAVSEMTPEQLAGAVIMASSADAVDTAAVADLHLGGVILMGSDGVIDGTDSGSPEEVAAVTSELQSQLPDSAFPLLIATDQEFGSVQRLRKGFTDFPEAAAYRSAGSEAADLVTRAAIVAGAEMSAVGINVNFAPDADLLTSDAATGDGSSAIGDRSYGSDPELVGNLTAAAVTGYQQSGVAATLKHFPGIGGISTDTHDALPTSAVDCEQWNAGDAAPFRAGIDAGAALVMTGHVLLPAVGETELPASLSPTVVTDLLRGSAVDGCAGLEFTGIAVTDALEMTPISSVNDSGSAAVAALAAGEDLLLMPVDPQGAVDGIVAALEDGSLDATRLAEAATRVLTLRAAVAHVIRPALSVVGSPEHQVTADEIDAAVHR